MDTTKVLLLTLLFCGTAVAGEPARLGGKVGVVKVTGRGAIDSPDAKFCSGFSLSRTSARHYLRTATVIDANARHYQFSWSPCFVKGTAVVSGITVNWRIEAMGLGSVVYPDGTEIMLGDERQRDRGGQ